MALLFRLPLLLLELLLRRLLRRGDDVTASVVTPEAARAAATPAPSPPRYAGASTNGAPPPTADEAIERRRAREAAAQAAPDPEPLAPLRPISEAGEGHVDREAEGVESFGPPQGVHGTITVDAPWPGYDDDTAPSIVARPRGGGPATQGGRAPY